MHTALALGGAYILLFSLFESVRSTSQPNQSIDHSRFSFEVLPNHPPPTHSGTYSSPSAATLATAMGGRQAYGPFPSPAHSTHAPAPANTRPRARSTHSRGVMGGRKPPSPPPLALLRPRRRRRNPPPLSAVEGWEAKNCLATGEPSQVRHWH